MDPGHDEVLPRAQEAARLLFVDVFTTICFSLGLPCGWTLLFSVGQQDVRLSQEDMLAQSSRETLSQFVRRFPAPRQPKVRIAFGDILLPDNVGPLLLPWVAAEKPSGDPSGFSRAANQQAAKKRASSSKSAQRDGQAPLPRDAIVETCALSHLATMWEAAHLISHSLSGPPFTWILATMKRCLELSATPLPRHLSIVRDALEKLTRDVGTSGTVYSGKVDQTFSNNILPLSAELHAALDTDDLWLDALGPSVTWISSKRMPTALIVRQEMGPQDGLYHNTWRPSKQAVLPSERV